MNSNSRPYKQIYAYAAITGTEPEYKDCKNYVTNHPDKYTYKTADYPCANARELDAYTTLSTDSQISRCYNQLIGKTISHVSKSTKLPLPDGALMLPIPGFIDYSGVKTVYNVMKDCSIRVVTINTTTGAIIKTQVMSRGQFNSKYKIEETTPAPTPTPEPEPDTGFDLGSITDFIKDNTLLVVGGGIALIAVVIVAAKVVR